MQEHKNHIVLIIPYFGRLPTYFGTYLASLKGKRFDVLWVSDLPVAEHPDNFKIVKMTFNELKTRIAERLGTPNVPYERVRDYHVDLTGFYHHAWQWRFRRVWRFVRYFFAGLDAARANGVSHALKRLVHVKRSGMG